MATNVEVASRKTNACRLRFREDFLQTAMNNHRAARRAGYEYEQERQRNSPPLFHASASIHTTRFALRT